MWRWLLAAEKHAQAMTERGALSQRYDKASSALAAVQARAEWPEDSPQSHFSFDQETFRLSTNAVLHCGQLRHL
jgi:hypothetical protein